MPERGGCDYKYCGCAARVLVREFSSVDAFGNHACKHVADAYYVAFNTIMVEVEAHDDEIVDRAMIGANIRHYEPLFFQVATDPR